jgi:hypothetical protein
VAERSGDTALGRRDRDRINQRASPSESAVDYPACFNWRGQPACTLLASPKEASAMPASALFVWLWFFIWCFTAPRAGRRCR